MIPTLLLRRLIPSLLNFLLLVVALVFLEPTAAAQSIERPSLDLSVGPNNTLVIPRSALGKEHLMSASFIPQALAATSTGCLEKSCASKFSMTASICMRPPMDW
jgi:hypothetical protein